MVNSGAPRRTERRPGEIAAVPVRHAGRWVAAGIVLVLAAMLVHSLVTNAGYHWATIKAYLFAPEILHGVVITLELTGAAMAIGIAGGIVLAIMRLSANPIVAGASWLYVYLFRGTPVLVQLFLWYNLAYLYGHLGIGVPFGPHASASTNSLISALTAGILGLGLNEAAYMAEIVRAGIISVDAGQSEAAASLGMRRLQIMRRIVLPQAMRVIVPPTGNETISMLKTSSLVSTVAVYDLFGESQLLAARTYLPIPLFLMASIWYLAMTTVLTIGQYYVERYYARGAARALPLTPFQRLRVTLPIWRLRPAGPVTE